MKFYSRERPVQAIQYTGDNLNDIDTFTKQFGIRTVENTTLSLSVCLQPNQLVFETDYVVYYDNKLSVYDRMHFYAMFRDVEMPAKTYKHRAEAHLAAMDDGEEPLVHATAAQAWATLYLAERKLIDDNA